MSTSTVQLRLQIQGNQAVQQLQRLNLQQQQSQQQQRQNLTQILQVQGRINTTVQQGGRYSQQQLRTGQSLVQTNRLLSQILQQQQKVNQTISSQLRQQVASTNQLRRNYQEAGRAAQILQRTGKLIKDGAAVVGGAVAGGAVVSAAMQKPRDYDKELTYLATTATSGQGLSAQNRLLARDALNNKIKTAVRQGGGTREDALDAANVLLASGKYDLKTVDAALNASTKTAFSTNAAATDAAQLTVRMADFGVKDLQKGHDIAVRGGQLGSFEYKDQAKWLAQQMAAAKAIGYSGEKGLIDLVALNQVVMTTAGSADEAGNNVVNLLAKLSSQDFSKAVGDAVTIRKGDPTKSDGKKKPKQVFDWTTYSMQQAQQGVGGVEAFVKLLERELAGNTQYQKLQKQMQSAKNDNERKALLENMSNIAMGSQLGEFLADRQAMMAALAAVYQKDRLNQIRQELPNADGTVDKDYDVVRQTEWAKDMAFDQEQLFAQSKAYNAVSEALGAAKEAITNFAREHETLAGIVYGGGVAIAGLAAAAGVATVALNALGGKGLLSRAGGLITGGRIAAGGGGLLAGGAAAGAGGGALAVGGQLLAAGALGYGIGTVINKQWIDGAEFGNKIGESVAQVLAFFGNDEAQAALEAQRQYDQMIAQQQDQNKQAATHTQLLQQLNQNILSLADRPPPPVLINGSSLLDNLSGASQQQASRHATIPYRADQ